MLYRDKALERTVIEKYCLSKTLRDVSSKFYDIGGYDMKNDEFKELCHEAWSDRFNYLCNEMTKNKDNGRHRIFNESKTTYIDCFPETEPF